MSDQSVIPESAAINALRGALLRAEESIETDKRFLELSVAETEELRERIKAGTASRDAIISAIARLEA